MDNRIIKAARFANMAHEGQFRKWGHGDIPYITHPMRVAGMVSINPNSYENMVVAAWLHDVVEDTSFTIKQIQYEYGARVSEMVEWMTNPSKGSNSSRAERKKMDREYLARAPRSVKIIKLCDRIDNLRETRMDPQTPYDFQKLYRKESLLLLRESLSDVEHDLEAELLSEAE